MTMYPLSRSPLFRLSSKRKLCELLHTQVESLRGLQGSQNYRIWPHTPKDKKKRARTIVAPKPILKGIQKRLQELLSRIEKPSYLYSGTKGKSYIDNAAEHAGQAHILNLDIAKFYDNCHKESVFRLFRYTFEMPDDIAWILADLATFEEALPAGSPCSQLLAFFAHRETFDKINQLANRYDVRFSLFVDDMTFSAPNPISREVQRMVQVELNKVGLSVNKKKTKRFTAQDFKIVTGVALSPTGALKVRNAQRLAIRGSFAELSRAKEKNPKLLRSLIGQIQAARQIEPQIYEVIYELTLKMWVAAERSQKKKHAAT